MFYVWEDMNSKLIIEVSRKMKERDVPPDKDECVAKGMTVEEFAEADWLRLMTSADVLRGPSWGSKGNMK